jgi:hypothetical protein
MALASAAVLCVYVCSYLSGAGICSLLLMTAEYMEYGDLSVYVLLCYASKYASCILRPEARTRNNQ